MLGKFAFLAGSGLLLAVAASSAQALPLQSAPLAGDDGLVTQVAGGCGPGFHRGPYGGCRPNYRPYGPPRPWVAPRRYGPRCWVRPTPYGPRRFCR